MATFLIERNLPGAWQLTPEQLREIACTSNAVVDGLGVPTPGTAATWRATRSTACTRPTTPTPFASTPGAAGSRPTS